MQVGGLGVLGVRGPLKTDTTFEVVLKEAGSSQALSEHEDGGWFCSGDG